MCNNEKKVILYYTTPFALFANLDAISPLRPKKIVIKLIRSDWPRNEEYRVFVECAENKKKLENVEGHPFFVECGNGRECRFNVMAKSRKDGRCFINVRNKSMLWSGSTEGRVVVSLSCSLIGAVSKMV